MGLFPGAVGSVNEEDVEKLLVGGNEESSCVGRDQDRSAAFQHANRVEESCEQVMSLGETTAIDSSTSDEESRLRREEEFRLDIGEGNFVHDFSDQASSEDEVEDNDGEDGGEEEEEEEEVEEEDVPVLGKHTAVRRAANLRYCANAEKLLNKFSAAKRKRIAVFALGDTVSVKIPGIDRVGADALRVPGKIVEVCKGDLFRIRTASGKGGCLVCRHHGAIVPLVAPTESAAVSLLAHPVPPRVMQVRYAKIRMSKKAKSYLMSHGILPLLKISVVVSNSQMM